MRRAGDPPAATRDGATAASTGGDEVERTEDGHHIVVNGRKWRATDTGIPEKLRAELVAVLMRARRLVASRGDEARPMVCDAKVALGGRGEPWWEEPTDRGRRGRVVGGTSWRDVVPVVREEAHQLAQHEVVVVQQKGEPVDVREARGPVRIAPGPALER